MPDPNRIDSTAASDPSAPSSSSTTNNAALDTSDPSVPLSPEEKAQLAASNTNREIGKLDPQDPTKPTTTAAVTRVNAAYNDTLRQQQAAAVTGSAPNEDPNLIYDSEGSQVSDEMHSCPTCRGTGERSIPNVTGHPTTYPCSNCQGTGQVQMAAPTSGSGQSHVRIPCPDCIDNPGKRIVTNAVGEQSDYGVCPRCSGTGEIMVASNSADAARLKATGPTSPVESAPAQDGKLNTTGAPAPVDNTAQIARANRQQQAGGGNTAAPAATQSGSASVSTDTGATQVPASNPTETRPSSSSAFTDPNNPSSTNQGTGTQTAQPSPTTTPSTSQPTQGDTGKAQ